MSWAKLTELKNFTSVPMLTSQESTEKIWTVGGKVKRSFDFASHGKSAYVQTIDLATGEVTLLPDMAFNRNISDACTVMVDDKYLYIIGGLGIHSTDDWDYYGYHWSADVTRNISMLDTDTGVWKTDLPRMKITRFRHQCLETTIDGNRGKRLW